MKITLVTGAVTGCDHFLAKALKLVRTTLEELGDTVADINLIFEDIPFFDGEACAAMKKHAETLKASDGIIFAFTTNFFAPTACMQNFFEYLGLKAFNACVRDKNVFLITSSHSGGEAESLAYAGKLLRHLGACDATRLGLNKQLLKELENNAELAETIEKYAEDYYRIIRQNRKFILPREIGAAKQAEAETSEEDLEQLLTYETKEEVTLEEIEDKYKLNEFTEKQEEDIREITQFFAGKYKEDLNITPNSNYANIMGTLKTSAPPPPRTKTTKQMTQSLVHYFQPQFAAGLTAEIQLNITGAENFNGFLTILNHECEYEDGVTENPDLTIICDTGVWTDIIKGKYSAQKAFMIGHLKVRGNFVLLTKFDQVFKPQG